MRDRSHALYAQDWREELLRLLRLAWPAALGQLAMMSMGLVDVAMIGRLGEEGLGAIALGNSWSFTWMILAIGMTRGLDPFFTQAFGAGDPGSAKRALARGYSLTLAVSVLLMGLHALAPLALAAMGQPAVLVPVAGEYATIVGLSMPLVGVFMVGQQYLQAQERMWPPMVWMLLANGINVLANFALIFGWGPFPALGVVGCAWATVISRAFMAAGLLLGARGVLPAWSDLLRVSRELGAVLRMGKMTLQAALQTAVEAWAFTSCAWMMGLLGVTAVSTHSVVLNMCSFTFMLPLGISAAAATRVGNLMGAGLPWGRAAWLAHGLGAAIMIPSCLAFLLVPELLVRIWTADPAVIALGVTLLPIAAAFQIVDGLQVVSFGVLRSVGDIRVPTWLNLFTWWVIALPVGAWLAYRTSLGPQGVWLGLTIGLLLISSLLILRLRRTLLRGGYRVEVEAGSLR